MEWLLTVLIPTIGRRTLPRAMKSVTDQTVPTSLVVVQDHDRTGTGPTLNRGLSLVETDWVATMGDDDVLHPAFAESLAAYVRIYDRLDLVVFQMQYRDGRVLPSELSPASWFHGDVGASYAVRTEVAREVGFLDVPSRPGGPSEDWEMISAVRDRGDRVLVVPVVRYFVRPV